jgi:hypothetical protein
LQQYLTFYWFCELFPANHELIKELNISVLILVCKHLDF